MSMIFIEYQEKKLKILNSLGRHSGVCDGISCSKCPFNDDMIGCFDLELLHSEVMESLVENYTLFNKDIWAEDILEDIANERFLYSDSTTICIKMMGKRKPKIGVARCNPKDKYDANLGKAIAFCRATGRKIPEEVLK